MGTDAGTGLTAIERSFLVAVAECCKTWPKGHADFLQIGYPPKPIISHPITRGWAKVYGEPVDLAAACAFVYGFCRDRSVDFEKLLDDSPEQAAQLLEKLVLEH